MLMLEISLVLAYMLARVTVRRNRALAMIHRTLNIAAILELTFRTHVVRFRQLTGMASP